jgi:TrmH RNA methyltransferase
VPKPKPSSLRAGHRPTGEEKPSRRLPAAAPVPGPPAPERVLKIAGFPAVAALFERAPERILRFFYEERMVPRVGAFCARMAHSHRPYRLVNGEELARIAGTVLHGGIVAVAEPPPILPLPFEEARQWARDRQPLFILDGVGNTHNLGAIARTLAFFGFERLIVSDHPAQAGLSESAHRVAEGGLEYLRVHRAAPLPAALQTLKQHYRIVGTALERGIPLEALRPDPRPTAIILGNEEAGLPPATLKACETIVTLRGAGAVQSLNVSAAAAILAYVLRQKADSDPRRPRPAGRTRRPSRPPA